MHRWKHSGGYFLIKKIRQECRIILLIFIFLYVLWWIPAYNADRRMLRLICTKQREEQENKGEQENDED